MQSLNTINSLLTTCGAALDIAKLVTPRNSKVIKIATDVKNVIKTAAMCGKETAALHAKLRRSHDIDISELDEVLLNAKDKETYYEILAQKLSYENLKAGDTIPQPLHFSMPEYQVYNVLEDRCGMKGIFFVPKVKGSGNPLLVFRGTDAKNIHNILDDFRENAASLNFERQKIAIHKELEKLSIEYGAFDVLGHSFGAAMAQKTTAEFPEYIAHCISYNGLRAGQKTVDVFNEKMRQYPHGMQKPEVWEYRHAKDIVSLLGSKSLPTTPGRYVTFGSIHDSISHIEAHSVLGFSRKLKKSIDTFPPDSYKEVADFAENIRIETGKIVEPIHDILL